MSHSTAAPELLTMKSERVRSGLALMSILDALGMTLETAAERLAAGARLDALSPPTPAPKSPRKPARAVPDGWRVVRP